MVLRADWPLSDLVNRQAALWDCLPADEGWSPDLATSADDARNLSDHRRDRWTTDRWVVWMDMLCDWHNWQRW